MLTTAGLGFAAPTAKPAKAPAAPELPPANVALEVTPAAGSAPWRVRITNKEDFPVRIAADERLLVLELTPPATTEAPSAKPAAKKPKGPTTIECRLPADIRPSSDESSALVVPPSRSWSATFDPLFYCFGARERAALVPGTSVKARFGWATRAKTSAPPFAAAPVLPAGAAKAPVKELETADALALTDALGTEGAAKPTDGAEATLALPGSVDVARGTEISTTVTLRNGGDRAITTLFRPGMLQFSVVGPHGPTACGEPRSVAAPIRELFATVPAKGSAQVAVLVTATCPAGTFDDAGIYRVTPRLDTTNASGRPLGMNTWDGVAVGKTPLLVRVRSSRSRELTRPTLD